MTAIQNETITLDDLSLVIRRCGTGPLVLCLHGFPDSAHTWDNLLPRLAAAGYTAVAPFMRGYRPSGIPRDKRYDAAALAGDVIGVADAVAPGARFSLVGHDWGAVAGYATASAAGDRLAAMVTAAVPPTARFLANLDLAQLRRSWYMGFFQLPGIAEAGLAARDMALVDRLWQAWSPHWRYADGDIAAAKQALGSPAARQAAIGYYRALRAALAGSRQRRQVRDWRTTVPTRLVHGTRDGCIGPDVFAGSQACFDGPFESLACDAGHFMHREQPEWFADRIIDWLNRHAAGAGDVPTGG